MRRSLFHLQRAHPRSRGENGYRWSALGSPSGSSPLTRGKRGRGRTLRLRRGLIPAHAGKTASPRHAPPSAEAHPRSRGENATRALSDATFSGSSPLTRGKLVRVGRATGDRGLIPAHAGKTRSSPWSPSPSTAHPRSRGENIAGLTSAEQAVGSSPLTRGKRDVGGVRASSRGLIPAHAGKTVAVGGGPSHPEAHPRSRGENGVGVSRAGHCVGSSPLTRGKHAREA